MKRSVLSLAVGAALVISDATACTTIFVGENASSDGAQYIARNEDMNPANPKVLQVNQEKVNKDTEFKTNLNKFTYTLPEKAMRYTTIRNGMIKVSSVSVPTALMTPVSGSVPQKRFSPMKLH